MFISYLQEQGRIEHSCISVLCPVSPSSLWDHVQLQDSVLGEGGNLKWDSNEPPLSFCEGRLIGLILCLLWLSSCPYFKAMFMSCPEDNISICPFICTITMSYFKHVHSQGVKGDKDKSVTSRKWRVKFELGCRIETMHLKRREHQARLRETHRSPVNPCTEPERKGLGRSLLRSLET